MAATDIRRSALEIVNEVQRRLGLNVTASLSETKHATMLLGLLNETIDELCDAGNWQELYRETVVSALSSVGSYIVAPTSGSGLVKNVYEVAFSGQTAPLNVISIEDIRRLQRLSGHGTPRQFALVGVDPTSANPIMRVHPIPGSAQASQYFSIAYFEKPAILVTADTTVQPSFPAQVLIQGLYARALLEESGGEATRETDAAFQLYERMRSEALNRFNSDTGTDIYFAPGGPT